MVRAKGRNKVGVVEHQPGNEGLKLDFDLLKNYGPKQFHHDMCAQNVCNGFANFFFFGSPEKRVVDFCLNDGRCFGQLLQG